MLVTELQFLNDAPCFCIKGSYGVVKLAYNEDDNTYYVSDATRSLNNLAHKYLHTSFQFYLGE